MNSIKACRYFNCVKASDNRSERLREYMFKLGKNNDNSFSSDIETVIGKNTQIKGSIHGSGNMRVDGMVEGEISITGEIVVGDAGRVIGNISGRSVLISGEVTGNISAESKLEIMPNGKLYGDVNASVLSIAEGAVFRGQSNMEPRPITNEEEIV